jgi:periplasmic copper chaperone A
MKRTTALTIAVLALGGLAACGDDEASSPEAESAWARTSPMAVEVGAMYMQISSPDDDRLTAVTVSPEIAARTEIHETVAADGAMTEGTMAEDAADDTMTEGTMAEGESEAPMEGDMGAMVMQQVPFLELPADETVSLEPGGYHVMLLGLAEPLEVGQTFDATLVFENADPLTVTVEVRDEAP